MHGKISRIIEDAESRTHVFCKFFTILEFTYQNAKKRLQILNYNWKSNNKIFIATPEVLI